MNDLVDLSNGNPSSDPLDGLEEVSFKYKGKSYSYFQAKKVPRDENEGQGDKKKEKDKRAKKGKSIYQSVCLNYAKDKPEYNVYKDTRPYYVYKKGGEKELCSFNLFFTATPDVISKYLSKQFLLQVNEHPEDSYKHRTTLCEVIFRECRFYMDIDFDFDEYDAKMRVKHDAPPPEPYKWEIIRENIINFIELYLPFYYCLDGTEGENKEEEEVNIYCLAMDASSNKKFSHHLTFFVYINGEECLFPHNSCFKGFIKGVHRDFVDQYAFQKFNQDQHDEVTIKVGRRERKFKNPGRGLDDFFDVLKLFIDFSVYSDNRNMRTFDCTKFNADRYLFPIFCNHPLYPQLDQLISEIPKKPRFFSEWDSQTRYIVLESFNKPFMFEIGLINNFPGWDKLRVIDVSPTQINPLFVDRFKLQQYEKQLSHEIRSKKKGISEPHMDVTLGYSIGDNRKDKRFVDKNRRTTNYLASDYERTDVSLQLDSLEGPICAMKKDLVKNKDTSTVASKILINRINSIRYSDGFITFGSYDKYCSIKGDYHKNNYVFIVLSCKTLFLYQGCYDEECHEKVLLDKVNISKVFSSFERAPHSTIPLFDLSTQCSSETVSILRKEINQIVSRIVDRPSERLKKESDIKLKAILDF